MLFWKAAGLLRRRSSLPADFQYDDRLLPMAFLQRGRADFSVAWKQFLELATDVLTGGISVLQQIRRMGDYPSL